jgi:hypothetical protein
MTPSGQGSHHAGKFMEIKSRMRRFSIPGIGQAFTNGARQNAPKQGLGDKLPRNDRCLQPLIWNWACRLGKDVKFAGRILRKGPGLFGN